VTKTVPLPASKDPPGDLGPQHF